MRLNHYFPFTELFDATDAGAGGGAAAGAAGASAGAAGAAGTGGSSAGANAGATAGAAGAGAAGAAAGAAAQPSGFTYREDRSAWIPPHRLSEVSNSNKTLKEQLDAANSRVAALAGVTPQDPNAARSAEVRAAFLSHFPHLKPLLEMTPDQISALTQAPEVASRVQTAEQRQWTRTGQQVLGKISTDVAEAMGVEKLDDDQKADLREAFSSWFKGKVIAEIRQSVQTTGREESASLQKYEEGDESLLKEFTTRYTKSWVEPARRTATAQTAGRIKAVPNSGGRSQVTSVDRPAKFNSLDERIEYASKVAFGRAR